MSVRTEPRFTRDVDIAVLVEGDGYLVALKLLARDDETRPQDAADLRALALVLGPEDRNTARTAVELIMERGHARGRSLSAMLDKYLDNAGTA